MRRFAIIILTCIFFYGCKKDGGSSDCTKDIHQYEFYSNSKIDTTRTQAGLFFQINPGNDLVFSYTHTGPDCKSIADEEYTDKFVFKVPAGVNSFNYQDAQLTDAMCLFIKISFFTNGASPATSGFVKGTKRTDGKWDVEINVEIGGSIGRLIINKTFAPH
jgi:hypothetical protein